MGFLVAGGASTACSRVIKPGRPVWAVSHQHGKYTPDKYIIGVGLASSAKDAKQKATDQIMEDLRTRLAGELKVRGAKLVIAGSPALTPSSAHELLSGLPEAHEVLAWSDTKGDRHYSMVAMNRTELVSSTRAQVKEWDMQGMELVGKAGAGMSDSPYSSLVNLMAATLLRVQTEQQRALLAVIDPSPPPAQKGPSLEELLTRVQDLLGRVRMTATYGKELSLNADAKQAVLVLSVDLKTAQTSVPFSGCPVAFESKGLKPVMTRVDPAGMATGRLQGLAEHAGQTLSVHAHMDGGTMLQDSGVDMDDARFAGIRKIFESKSAEFHLKLIDKRAQKIAIAMAETRGGELRQNSRVVELLQRKLMSKGYNVFAFDELDVQLPQDPTPKTMSEAFRNKADLLIYGVAASSLERKVSHGLVFVKATAQVVLVRVDTGKVLVQKGFSAKSPGMDLASASARAFASLARKIAAALEEQGGITK